jgi:Peptidase family C50
LEYNRKRSYKSFTAVQWPEQPLEQESDDEDMSDLLATLKISPEKSNTTFSADNLLERIPVGCTVVSIHLSESKEHFVLSKVQSQGCIVVRLPLIKYPSDADEEPFTFKNALTELTDIITLNNETAQNSKDVADRMAKEEWWNTRNELDGRLALFVQNMENCWIGGFTVICLRCIVDSRECFGDSSPMMIYLPNSD